MPFLPESPRYIMSKTGDYDRGVEELKKIRQGNVTVEADEIWAEVQAEKGTVELGFRGLFSERNLRKRVLIAVMLLVCQQLTGVNAFLSYSGTIFAKAGMSDPIVVNTVFNGWMIIFCALGLMTIDSKFGGRKCQLLVATCIMGPPLIVAATAIGQHWPSFITVICVCIYGGGFQFAWGLVPWIYPSELFSMKEKESAVSLAVFCNYVYNALIVYVTPLLMAWSTPGAFYIFGGLNVLCGLFVFIWVKETKGVPLEMVPALFTRGLVDPCGGESAHAGANGEVADPVKKV